MEDVLHEIIEYAKDLKGTEIKDCDPEDLKVLNQARVILKSLDTKINGGDFDKADEVIEEGAKKQTPEVKKEDVLWNKKNLIAETSEENCGHCNHTVDVLKIMAIQQCPICFNPLLPCNFCFELTDMRCVKPCPLEKLRDDMNMTIREYKPDDFEPPEGEERTFPCDGGPHTGCKKVLPYSKMNQYKSGLFCTECRKKMFKQLK